MPQLGPKLSVVAYVYNYADFLPQMVHSVLSQTYTDFELFVLDDGSDDETLRILSSFSSDRRLRFATQNHRGRDRLHETFNRCLAETCGEFVAIANGDDVMAREKLSLQIAVMERRSDIDVVFFTTPILSTDPARVSQVRSRPPSRSPGTLKEGWGRICFSGTSFRIRRRYSGARWWTRSVRKSTAGCTTTSSGSRLPQRAPGSTSCLRD